MFRPKPDPERRLANQPRLDALGADLGLAIARQMVAAGPARLYRPSRMARTSFERLAWGLDGGIQVQLETALIRGTSDPDFKGKLAELDDLLAMHLVDAPDDRPGSKGLLRSKYRSAGHYFGEAFETMAYKTAELAMVTPQVVVRDYDGPVTIDLLHRVSATSPVLRQLANGASVHFPQASRALRVNDDGSAAPFMSADRLRLVSRDGQLRIELTEPLAQLRTADGLLRDLAQERRSQPYGDHRRCPGAMASEAPGGETAISLLQPLLLEVATWPEFWPEQLRSLGVGTSSTPRTGLSLA